MRARLVLRSIVLTLLVATLTLSGCLSTTNGGDGGVDGNPGATPAPKLDVLTLVSETDGQGEPSLGVTPDGVIFTNIGSDVYRSFDEGRTWENMGDPAAPIPNNDPDLAVDLDGRVWESRLYALVCNEVSVSEDLGETWSTFPAVCNLPVGDRQYVVPTKDCEAFLYWHQLPTFYQTVMRTADCGTTWLPTGPAEFPDHHLLVNEGSSWGGGGFYNPTTDSVFLTYTRSPGILSEDVVGQIGSEERPGYSVTRDDFTWEEGVGPAFDGGRLGLGLVMGAADDAGNIYLTWGESFGDEGVQVFVAKSEDDGRTWSEKIRVDEGVGSRVFPAIAAGEDGQVAVAYYTSPDAAFPDNAGNWTVELAILDLTDATTANPVLEYLSLTDGRVIKSDGICISGTTCTSGREFLDYFALKTMPDGSVITTYNELTDDGELLNWFAKTRQTYLRSS